MVLFHINGSHKMHIDNMTFKNYFRYSEKTVAFHLLRKGLLKSTRQARVASFHHVCRNVEPVSSVQRQLKTQSWCHLLTDAVPSSVAVSQRHFSISTTHRFIFKKQDTNIDPESKQPYTHPEKGELVYSGPLTIALKRLKRLSFFTSFMGLALIPYFIANNLAWAAIGGFGFFIFGTPCLIHFVFAKNYVTDIYFNDRTKVFHLAKLSFFLLRKEIQFTANDVTVPDLPGAYATYKIKDVPVFINRTLFTSKEVYKHMVGYDKPLDLDIPEPVNLDMPDTDFSEVRELEKKIKSKSVK